MLENALSVSFWRGGSAPFALRMSTLLCRYVKWAGKGPAMPYCARIPLSKRTPVAVILPDVIPDEYESDSVSG